MTKQKKSTNTDKLESNKIDLGNLPTSKVKDVGTGDEYDASDIEVRSQTTLESDKGEGNPLIIKVFTFLANPETFKNQQPTAQELFNIHLKQMEMALWDQGLKVEPKVEPRLVFNKRKTQYQFFIGCRLARGRILSETPLTLSEIVHSTASSE